MNQYYDNNIPVSIKYKHSNHQRIPESWMGLRKPRDAGHNQKAWVTLSSHCRKGLHGACTSLGCQDACHA